MCFPKSNSEGGIQGALKNVVDAVNYNKQYNSQPHEFSSGPNGTVQSSNYFNESPQEHAAGNGVMMGNMAKNGEGKNLSSLFGGPSIGMGASRMVK